MGASQCILLNRRQAFRSASYCKMLSVGRFLCLFIYLDGVR